jgi:inner membrane protein
MPTIMTHAAVGLALGRLFTARKMPWLWFWGMLAGLAMLPDLDVLGHRFGIRYSTMLGHRGLTHSLSFAFIISALAAVISFRRCQVRFWDLWGLFFVATASHGILDACTHGGPFKNIQGVAFLAPFDDERFWLPYRPIQASLFFGPDWFTNPWTLTTLWDELVWVWLPTGFLVGLVELYRKIRTLPPPTPNSSAEQASADPP